MRQPQTGEKPFANRKKKRPEDYGIYCSNDRVSVDISRQGKRLRKAFMYSVHGPDGALKAARAWRDQLIATVPLRYRRDLAQRPKKNSKGIPGVFCVRHATGEPRMWVATTQLAPGTILSKAFSTGRYGRNARKMAIAERALQLELMPLNVITGGMSSELAAVVQRYRGTPAPIDLPYDESLLQVPEIPPEVSVKRIKSGYSGVICELNQAQQPVAWVARTRVGGVEQKKAFSIRVYGTGNAKRLAVDERLAQLRRARAATPLR